jgi:selenocysteine lyase/cysteine desulfurase
MLSTARAMLATDEFSFADLRAREFSRLDRQQHVYLDYTGSALYADSQIRAHHALLREGLFGNPHSEHRPSRASADVIETARDAVLRFFDVDALTHDVVFTANTSAAIKLVAESYPFAPDTPCILSADNHNSVNGIREYARRAGAPVRYLPLDDELRLRDAEALLAQETMHARGLVAFPAQSNFSGVRHPLSLVTSAKSLGYDVLLDIAGFAPSHAISLRDCPADFAALSFYKLFGYPTGLGALVARREALDRLRRPWFAGGTVTYASVHADTHRLRRRHEGFEDGTQNFLGIAALAPGFELLEEVDMTRLSAHVARLASKFLSELTALRHANGVPVAHVYGPHDMRARGGTIAFNVCDRDGKAIPYSVVEMTATRANIAVRGGCFCNPGCAEAALALDPTRTAACLATLGSDFTVERFADCLDSPVGAVRVSFGLANNDEDVRRVISLMATLRD